MPGSTCLLLIRHGETVANRLGRLAGWTDTPLTPAGERQAARLAEHLAASERLGALYASPLQRAWHTALAISRRLGLPPIPLPDLREWHGGDTEDLTREEIEARFPGLQRRAQRALRHRDLSFRWPGGESRGDFEERVQRAFAAIVAAHPGRTAAVVAHGGVFDRYLRELLHDPQVPERPYLFRHCSVTEVVIGAGQARLVRRDVVAWPTTARVPTP